MKKMNTNLLTGKSCMYFHLAESHNPLSTIPSFILRAGDLQVLLSNTTGLFATKEILQKKSVHIYIYIYIKITVNT